MFSQVSGYPELINFLFVKVQTFLFLYNKQLLIRLEAGREEEFRVYPQPM